MYKLKKRITSEILENLGFTKKDYIISPERPLVEGDNEFLIGQMETESNYMCINFQKDLGFKNT